MPRPLCLLLLFLLGGWGEARPPPSCPRRVASPDTTGHDSRVSGLRAGRALAGLLAVSLASSPVPVDPQHGQEAIEMKEKKQPLDFPGLGSSRLVPYGGHRDTGREAREAAKRQEVPPPQQSLQEKTPCKDFFRKTFSSCK
uniref:Somatostatin/Cortistatin C-terminal domain-containing protein n=1 Tax=Lynx canadensis TaxID=61383 RepID=A0A667I8Z3_LYNCA